MCYEQETRKSFSCLSAHRRKKPSLSDDDTRVDLTLQHDICPQRGGDYEPLDI